MRSIKKDYKSKRQRYYGKTGYEFDKLVIVNK